MGKTFVHEIHRPDLVGTRRDETLSTRHCGAFAMMYLRPQIETL